VAVLMILRPSDSKNECWVIVTTQPRIPLGHLQYCEIPGGMLDGSGNFNSAAAREIEEEMGLRIPASELIDMTALASSGSEDGNEHEEVLKSVMYPSPAVTDESISIFLWEKVIDRHEIESLKTNFSPTAHGRTGQMITVRLIKYEELWKFGFRDMKTIAAWALYGGLKRAKHPGLRGGKAVEASPRLLRRSNVMR
jgi:ADP-sugar diphosphatase